MSDYLYLQPEGIGGAEVECMMSYFCRLALIHNLTPHVFHRHLSQWWLGQGEAFPLSKSLIQGKEDDGKASVGRAVRDLGEALVRATGCDLIRRTSLIPLYPAISSRSGGAGWRTRAWCVACWMEDQKNGRKPYDRLIWTLRPIVRCHIHNIVLRKVCTHCSASQNYYHRSGNITLCWSCKASLIDETSLGLYAKTPQFGEKDCLSLVTAIGNGRLVEATGSAFQIFLKEVYEKLPKKRSLRHLAEIMSLPTYDSHVLIKDRHTFERMIRICVSSGADIVHILTAPKDAAKEVGDLLSTKVADRRYKMRYLTPENIISIEARVRQELAKSAEEPIASLRSVARDLGVDVERICYHFPDLQKQYAEKRRIWLYHSAKDRDRILQRRLCTMVRRYPGPAFKKKRDLETCLMKSCGVGRKSAREAVDRMFKQIKRLGRFPSP